MTRPEAYILDLWECIRVIRGDLLYLSWFVFPNPQC